MERVSYLIKLIEKITFLGSCMLWLSGARGSALETFKRQADIYQSWYSLSLRKNTMPRYI